MKQSRTLFLLVTLTLWLTHAVSCSEDESYLQPSVTSISMEGEGGEYRVTLNVSDWEIEGILHKNSDMNMFGKIFSADGELLDENVLLKLKGIGELSSQWYEKGFRVIRDTPASLIIKLDKNRTEEEFNFSVLLKAGEERKEIIIKQKIFQGYSFGKLDFVIKEGDGDSIVIKERPIRIIVSSDTGIEIVMSPCAGVDKESYFESEDNNAFWGIVNDSIKVLTPIDLYNDKLYFGNQESIYNDEMKREPNDFEDTKKDIKFPAGKHEIISYVECRKRKVSYVLTLINKRTKEEQTVEGKWIETAPTGKYTIVY